MRAPRMAQVSAGGEQARSSGGGKGEWRTGSKGKAPQRKGVQEQSVREGSGGEAPAGPKPPLDLRALGLLGAPTRGPRAAALRVGLGAPPSPKKPLAPKVTHPAGSCGPEEAARHSPGLQRSHTAACTDRVGRMEGAGSPVGQISRHHPQEGRAVRSPRSQPLGTTLTQDFQRAGAGAAIGWLVALAMWPAYDTAACHTQLAELLLCSRESEVRRMLPGLPTGLPPVGGM